MNTYHENQVPWPAEKPRCADRRNGRFNSNGKLGLNQAASRVRSAVSAFTRTGKAWRTKSLWIFADGVIGARGEFLNNQPANIDPAVVVSFDLDGQEYTIAVDALTDPAQNLAAIAQAIDAMRAVERYGVFTVSQLLHSFAALPAPGTSHPQRVSPFAGMDTAADINKKYRALAAERHPDKGGSTEAMAELNRWRDEALREVTS